MILAFQRQETCLLVHAIVLKRFLDPVEINIVLTILIAGLFIDETGIKRADSCMRVDSDTMLDNSCNLSVRTLQL